MWICLNNAFVSVVADRLKPDRLMVRSRLKIHLQNLFGKKAKIIVDAGTDYKYRVFVDRKAFAALIASKIEAINYGNFKGSVKDQTLSRMYHNWWFDHYGIQDDD